MNGTGGCIDEGQITCVVEVRSPAESRLVVILRGAEGRSALDALLAAADEAVLADAAGSDPGDIGAPDGWDRLTRAERSVVSTVGLGSTNAQAAMQLFVSTHTIAAHLRSIYMKLGIGSRIELVRLVSSGRVP